MRLYVDTRGGVSPLFSAPEEVPDYRTWLLDRYRADTRAEEHGGARRYVYSGTAQAVNALLTQALHEGLTICCLGPHALAAAALLRELSAGEASVEVY